MSENNHMWTALAILGGIYAYSMLKEDAGKLKDGVVDIAKDVAGAVNITKDTNLAYKGAGAIFGEDTIIDKVGGGIARILGTDPMKDYPKETKTTQTAKNHRGARVNAPIEASAPKLSTASNHRGAADNTTQSKFKNAQKTGITDTSPNILAKNFNGQWKKLINGQWLPLTKSDKVVTIRGVNVVKPYLWKP